MRKNIICAVAALIAGTASLTACGPSIQVKKDPYRGIFTVTMEMRHKSSDWKVLKGRVNTGRYYREVRDGKNQTDIHTVDILARDVNARISEEAFLMIDGRVYRTKALWTRDAQVFGLSLVSKPNISASKLFKVPIVLTPEIEAALRNAASVSYRLYADNDPVTLEVSNRQLKYLKKFLNAECVEQ
jgi:hypothetical protein